MPEPIYTEEIETDITIKNRGDKEVKKVTVTYKDGVEVGRTAPHRYVVVYDEDVPAEVVTHINNKKGKQPTLPPQGQGNN